jgi:hypothetical protein
VRPAASLTQRAAAVQIATLEQHVLQLRTEKEHVQEQLAIEKRINQERAVARDAPAASLASDGLQDFDPIDMSFLPMWQGLQLSNEKIRAMPADTLKMLIQTILQDLRNRLANLPAEGAPGAPAALGSAVSSAFAFLNRWCARRLLLPALLNLLHAARHHS